ncbi:MAG: phasin [Stappiaceae bacterium]
MKTKSTPTSAKKAAPAKKPTARTNATKAAPKKVAPAPENEVFSMQNIEVPTAVREVAEKSVEQARVAYDKFKTVAEGATDVLEDSMESSRQSMIEINVRALDAARANTDATFDFFKELVSVKSISEAVELQSAFARKQFEAVTEQSKELQELSTKFAGDVAAPAKDAFEKVTKDFKVA